VLKLQLFGVGQASFGGQPLTGFPGQQWHRLLCYLLLNCEHPHPRERLAAVFWSEYPTATSRTYLRNALWRLRQALQSAGAQVDEYVAVDDDSIRFLSSSPHWLDVQEFENPIKECQDISGEQLDIEQVNRLEKAANLYVGELLEGVYEDWCLYDRERLRLLHLSALHKMLVFHEHNGTYERGLAHGRRILDIDPTRERVHRQVMRLYWLLGERHEALTQYKCCVQVLHEELGIPPTERTKLLHEQMIRNRFDPRTWRIHPDDLLPERIKQSETLEPFAEHVLDRLHRLQAINTETTTELRHIERMISQVLLTAR
jgi:DNA-binding SARP family transcriptional activator